MGERYLMYMGCKKITFIYSTYGYYSIDRLELCTIDCSYAINSYYE